jgi:pyrimidine operon attenuation protein/uracil phosphoribosyltransferase
MTQLALDAEALYQQLYRQVSALAQATDGLSVGLVGIWSGGAWLAERLQKDLGLAGSSGALSITLHRDDYAERGLSSTAGATRLPFEVDGRHIILVDDVLYTGRTIRAALNELFDFGRPARVSLAVLVDRGGRELPIEAQCAAARLSLPASQRLSLAQDAQGRLTFAVESV